MRAPCVSVATGGGKTWILSSLVETFVGKGKRCITITHVKELIKQLSSAASQLHIPHGIYAASLSRKETHFMYTIAQIQSCYKNMISHGQYDVVFVDECHLINNDNEGMYQTALKALYAMNNNVRIIGLSATPFRMDSGLIYGEGKMFDACVAHISMRQLIDEKYLTPIVGKNADTSFDDSKLHLRGGEFIPGEIEDLMADSVKVSRAIRDFLGHASSRNRTILFSSGNKHSRMLVDELRLLGESADWISGEHTKTEREEVLEQHRTGKIKHLVNCGVLTTGYDDPEIDTIGMFRPTRSPVLVLQCAGRGLRLHTSKQSCLFLDYGGCLAHFGPLDLIEKTVKEKKAAKGAGGAPTKTCPQCANVVFASTLMCECGYKWTRNLNHEERACDGAVLSGQQEVPVHRVSYSVSPGKDGKVATVRVIYWSDLTTQLCSEWLSVDTQAHPFARKKFFKWVSDTPRIPGHPRALAISDGVVYGCTGPNSVEIKDAVTILPYLQCLAHPSSLVIEPDYDRPKYKTIVRRIFKRESMR